MDTGFGKNQLYSACRLTFTHHFPESGVECEPLYGTGFLVQFPEGDNRFGVVTNRHLTEPALYHPAEYEGATTKSLKVEIWQSKNLRIEFTIDDPTLLCHEDQTIDVTVIPFGPGVDLPHTFATPYDKFENLFPDPKIDTLVFNHGLSWEYLLECEKLWPSLEPGEFVLFPGYPIWYDKSQVRPVFRSGMIASDPQTDYRRRVGDPSIRDGNRQVLFDAFSTSGNSGSPVFVAQRGIPPLPIHMNSGGDFSPSKVAELKFSGYHRSFLIGINAGHINDDDGGRDSHAGLSRMYKLSAVMDILRSNTVVLVRTPPSES
ncbi:hypothetical protein [Mycobacterium kubicae]|uniref:hypothetical protein n=1 Tax=Mycobacterium kubicae TaxID=120959 RepID=UPI0010425614|nr:hypothetical protein [Mycobacterium kubicae]